MTSSQLTEFISLSSKHIDGYTKMGLRMKHRFHKLGMLLCYEIARRLKLESYQVRSDLGPMSSGGEVSLLSDGIYMRLCFSPHGLMYGADGRTINWMLYTSLNNLDRAVKTIKRIVGSEVSA